MTDATQRFIEGMEKLSKETGVTLQSDCCCCGGLKIYDSGQPQEYEWETFDYLLAEQMKELNDAG